MTVENETVRRVMALTSGKYRFLKDVPRSKWTDEHEAELLRQIADDPDDFEGNGESKPFAEVFPELAASINRGGRPKLDNPKKQVSIRLDADLVDRLKADGNGWQTRANELLRKAVGI